MWQQESLHRGRGLALVLWPGRDILWGFGGGWCLGHSVSVWKRLGLGELEGDGPGLSGDPEASQHLSESCSTHSLSAPSD